MQHGRQQRLQWQFRGFLLRRRLILVKRPGNSTITPWHQDQPYYCVEGDRTVSFWTPLDAISRSVSLECVAGSHRWNTAGYRPTRSTAARCMRTSISRTYRTLTPSEISWSSVDGHGAGGRDRIRLSHHSRRAGQCVECHSTSSFHPAGSVPMRASCGAVPRVRRHFPI